MIEDQEQLQEIINKEVNEQCGKKHDIFTALDNFSVCSQPHLDQSDTKIITQLRNIAKILGEFLCDNDGSNLLELRSNDIDECYKQTKYQIVDCIMPYAVQLGSVKSFYELVKHVNENECDDISKNAKGVAECYVTIMNGCSNFLGSVYRKIVDTTYSEIPCKSNLITK